MMLFHVGVEEASSANDFLKAGKHLFFFENMMVGHLVCPGLDEKQKIFNVSRFLDILCLEVDAV